MTHWLGTDGQGRDMLSAMLYGLRISLLVGLASGGIALVVGTIVGLVAAFRGGWVDAVLMRIVDLQLSFPTILVALILLVLLGRGVDKIIFALVVVQWAYFARTVRGVALVEGSRDYVEAARGLRLPPLRILMLHILPNCLPTMLVVATIQMAQAISLEATLSFLGLGLPPTRPSLGPPDRQRVRLSLQRAVVDQRAAGPRASRPHRQRQRPGRPDARRPEPAPEGLRRGDRARRPGARTSFLIGGQEIRALDGIDLTVGGARSWRLSAKAGRASRSPASRSTAFSRRPGRSRGARCGWGAWTSWASRQRRCGASGAGGSR
jgi:ABC-type methionine transport system permease subunit